MDTIEALSRQLAAQAIQGAIDAVNRAFDGAVRPREFSRDDLRRLHAQGLSDARISVELGASRSAVQNARRRLGLAANFARFGGGAPRSHNTLSDDDLRRMHGDGMSDLAIARSLGISNMAVYRRRVALGLPANYKGRGKL